jgi:F-box and leucine-rich repeat protein GRR1
LTGVHAFLRDDLEEFCRDAPAEFTQHQREVFCVFSGQGVLGLRRYLNTEGRPRYEEDEITLTGDNAHEDADGADALNDDDHAMTGMTGMMPMGPGMPAQVEIVQDGEDEPDEELEDGEGDGRAS